MISKYIILNPGFNQIDELRANYIIIHIKEYEAFTFFRVFKILTKTNNIKYIRLTESTKIKRIHKEKENFSKILEMRITIFSSYRYMTFDYYRRQKKFVCEIEFIQIFDRDPFRIKKTRCQSA